MRPVLRAAPFSRRSFASSVLLSKHWDNDSVADIKAELQRRRLSQKGNKATLITRITEHDRRKQLQSFSASPVEHQLRRASSGSAPEVPATSEPPSTPTDYLAITLPDLSHPLEDAPVQIPFAPDHWESGPVVVQPAEPSGPKVSTVTLPETLVGGGPSHNVYQPSDVSSLPPSSVDSKPLSTLPIDNGGLLSDVVNDLCLPISVKVPTIQWGSSENLVSSNLNRRYSQLDLQEVRGIWTLVGILVGSWILGGVAKPVSEVEESA